ncbi:hypothetical protein NKR23_g3367 [Pleurostoma richardsiae]|uniref:Uncharacterized protein n=1 Tax=Pleurostoma richardsiae TaxID=41990 RepID=A0AA38VTE3_9PEZI|nr:hypothetical protein NKR23_g3367 [Pleurostoma richardsiae]
MGKEEVVTQNVSKRYLKKAKLQKLLEEKFPGHENFNIRLKDDQWSFTTPAKVDEVGAHHAPQIGLFVVTDALVLTQADIE